MTLLVFSGCVTCLLLGTVALSWAQKTSPSLHFQSVLVGEDVTLKCVCERTRSDIFFWYKQPLGLKPQLMSAYLDIKKNGSFVDAFKNDPRLKLETDKDKNHLKISNLKMSDSATYYCISSDSYGFQHLEGYTVHVKDSTSDIHASVDQSSSENFHAGDSVTLNCTVHTGSCDGEHRVYWFKDSGDSHPGLIYTHGGRNDQCGRKNNTQTHSCVYELHMERLTESHAGIYYCAVVSCGHILFGNGTKLDFTEGSFPPFVYFLSGALAASLIFLTLYAIHKIRTRRCRAIDLQDRSAVNLGPDAEGTKDLHYAALRHSRLNKSRREGRRRQ
uniref:Ig-like domain-containing protein n=1 Tax=Oryzias latipes TaxID=8090 RepID=A0A3P9M9W9_ORYLA